MGCQRDEAWQEGRDCRHRSIPRFNCGECLLQAVDECRLAIGFRFRAQNAERVAECRQHPPRHDVCVEEFLKPTLQHRKHADEVSTVHRRDILWGQWGERAGVIPVEEMASMAIHLRQRVKRQLGASDQPADGAVSKVAGGEIGQQTHGDVGGAGACGDHLLAVVLHVVRRQPVGLFRDELLEVPPGFAGGGMQKGLLPGAEMDRSDPHRQADPPGHQRADQPEQQYRQNSRENSLSTADKQHARGTNGQSGRAGHGAHKTGGIPIRSATGLGGSAPLQQMFVRHEHAHERAHHGIRRESRLVGQKHQRQAGLRERLCQ